MNRSTKIKTIIAYATPDKQIEIPVLIEAHANAAMAIKKSGILTAFPEITFPDIVIGIYGRRVLLDAGLSEGDRIEIYRPLITHPMQARRNRAKK